VRMFAKLKEMKGAQDEEPSDEDVKR
jgi:hypothetical protein